MAVIDIYIHEIATTLEQVQLIINCSYQFILLPIVVN